MDTNVNETGSVEVLGLYSDRWARARVVGVLERIRDKLWPDIQIESGAVVCFARGRGRQSLVRFLRLREWQSHPGLALQLDARSDGKTAEVSSLRNERNKTFRATVAFLIVRDHGHELVFAKALESLGINWGKTLPIPNFDAGNGQRCGNL